MTNEALPPALLQSFVQYISGRLKSGYYMASYGRGWRLERFNLGEYLSRFSDVQRRQLKAFFRTPLARKEPLTNGPASRRRLLEELNRLPKEERDQLIRDLTAELKSNEGD